MLYQSLNTDFIQDDSFHPNALLRKLERTVPRTSPYRPYDHNEPPPDPIIHDLMKLTPHRPFILAENGPEEDESINIYSAKLSELLYLLIDEHGLDDNSRISIEASFFELTSYIPTPLETWTLAYQQAAKKQKTESLLLPQSHPIYPNETLSKILVDNYNQLHKFASSYFNLSLSSHVTKYLVELVYSLQYWEIYHLIHILPDLEHFLKLLEFEITQTTFGPIIKPPVNYLNDDMLSGLQYPFPYPFYNYSYHSFNTIADDRKFNKISIKSYSGVSLPVTKMIRRKSGKSIPAGRKRKQIQEQATSDKSGTQSRTNSLNNHNDNGGEIFPDSITKAGDSDSDESEEDEDEVVQEGDDEEEGGEDEDEDEDDDDHSRAMDEDESMDLRGEVSSTQYPLQLNPDQDDRSSPVQIGMQEPQLSVQNDKPSDISSSEDENMEKEGEYGEYSDNSPMKLEEGSSNPIFQYQNQLKFVPQSPRKLSGIDSQGLIFEGSDDKNKKNKSSVIHQCHLTDPNTLRRCLKIFYGKNELLRHQEFVHATKKKIYKCIYCSRNGAKVQSYPRHDSLARHIRRKHGVTGKENKMAVNYAKDNVEVVDDPNALITKQHHFGKPLPHPQYLNSDFTIKPGYAGFLSFSSKDKPAVANPKNPIMDVVEFPQIQGSDDSDNSDSITKESPSTMADNVGFQTFRVAPGSSDSNEKPESPTLHGRASILNPVDEPETGDHYVEQSHDNPPTSSPGASNALQSSPTQESGSPAAGVDGDRLKTSLPSIRSLPYYNQGENQPQNEGQS